MARHPFLPVLPAQLLRAAPCSTLLLALNFATDLHELYGAPAAAWVEIDLSTPGKLAVRLTLQNKTATRCAASATCVALASAPTSSLALAAAQFGRRRLPEAAWVTFTPVGAGASGSHWLMDKIGEPVDPLDVADGASRGLHAVLSGVNFTTATVATEAAAGTKCGPRTPRPSLWRAARHI